MTKSATQAKAEKLAWDAIKKYAIDCAFESPEHAANCLTTLLSVAGVVMAHQVGGDNAFDRLVSAAHFVRNNTPATPSTPRLVQ